jgi:leader peptidase (prepilin peptidase)/N-methyltransferase
MIKIDAWVVLPGAAAAMASIVMVAGAAGWLGASLALVMFAIAAVDARSFIIPDPLNAAGLALGLLQAGVLAEAGVASALGEAALRAAALALTFYLLRLFYFWLRGRQGIGLGDVKLAAVAGAWLDWTAIPLAMELAAASALIVVAVRHFVLRRQLRATTRLPFGLFFAPAIWLAWALQATVLQPY